MVTPLTEDVENALLAKEQIKSKKYTNNYEKSVTCFICDEVGHFASKCQTKGNNSLR